MTDNDFFMAVVALMPILGISFTIGGCIFGFLGWFWLSYPEMAIGAWILAGIGAGLLIGGIKIQSSLYRKGKR